MVTDPAAFAHDFGGIKVSALTADQFLLLVREHLSGRSRLDVSFLNPDYARRAFLDPGLRDRINRFDVVLVDGLGVRLLSPLFGFRVPMRLDTDFISPRVFALLAELGSRVFLFGSKPGIAQRAGERLQAAFPGVTLAGVEHGFHDVLRGHPGRYEEEDSRRIVAEMNDSGADFVLVSLPTPVQQNWLADHRASIRAPVVMTGGSYIDHMAENERWPASWYPAWADRYRLNWFYRLAKEPRRLWKRYSIEFFAYGLLTLRARFRWDRRGRRGRWLTGGNAKTPRRR